MLLLVCFVVAIYTFAIVHCACRTETGPIKKGGGGNLTKRVGGITKPQSAETRASNPHWQPHSTFHATSSNISLVFCAVGPSHSETPRFLGNQQRKRWMEGGRKRKKRGRETSAQKWAISSCWCTERWLKTQAAHYIIKTHVTVYMQPTQ